MFTLAPSEEISYDEHGKTFVLKRDPPNIQCVLLVFVDELLHGQGTGFRTRDFSRPVSDPAHWFWLKVILLFFMGDYPGQGKVANMMHTGVQACHWCHHDFEYHSQGHNVARGTRQQLPPRHHIRSDDSYNTVENRPPPAARTHTEICEKAAELAGLRGAELKAAQKASGVYGFCVLAYLLLFDLVWDICGDMMHLIKGTWGRRLLPMLKGNFVQAPPKKPSTTHADGNGGQVDYTPEEMAARTAGYNKAKQEWTRVRQVQNT
jgi:hypothetical protein